MTSRTSCLSSASASAFNERKINADKSSGLNSCFPNLTTVVEPINRLNEATVLSGYLSSRSFAVAPTTNVPLSSTLTTDGVRNSPCAFVITTGTPSFK